jgi:hypothetical protein
LPNKIYEVQECDASKAKYLIKRWQHNSSSFLKQNTMTFEEGFLKDIIKRFQSYKDLGDKTFAQLTNENFFYQPSVESNSIAIIIHHMYGNMMSRFTNFLTEDGEKPWRQRDEEFEPVNMTQQDLISSWNKGWERLFETLNSLKPGDLTKTTPIRNEPMPAYDALLRALAHLAYHVGQIVYLGKAIKDTEWKTLTIPKKQSNQFNDKMAQQKNQSV